MFTSRRKAAAVSALALAMTLGLAAPASAVTYTLTSDESSISSGEVAVITTDAPVGQAAYVFVNGVGFTSGPLSSGMPFAWNAVSPCVTIDVTLRVYYEVPGAPAMAAPSFSDAYAGSVTIEFIGDNSPGCNPTWGDGAEDEGGSGGSGGSDDSGEPLAKTGSDASTVASLTGVAGAAALVVAAAVALRLRRASR
jgi:hypothetical protein